MNFGGSLRARGARSLAAFGDSITVGLSASSPEFAWPQVLARAAGVGVVHNRAVAGTILQGSAMADGLPRAGNGVGRYREALLGQARADGVAILYGYNDARCSAAPLTVNLDGFVRDYRVVLAGLLEGGYAPAAIAIGSPPYLPDAGFALGSAGFTGQDRAGLEAHVQAVAALAGEFWCVLRAGLRDDGHLQQWPAGLGGRHASQRSRARRDRRGVCRSASP